LTSSDRATHELDLDLSVLASDKLQETMLRSNVANAESDIGRHDDAIDHRRPPPRSRAAPARDRHLGEVLRHGAT
jgi:hypothetical protein